MMIKLTGVPHPDLNEGKPHPVYIDASRVLLITAGTVQHPRLGSIEAHREAYDKLYRAVSMLAEKVGGYVPEMTDPVAVGWMRTAQAASEAVANAYRCWGGSYNQADVYPRVDCTEVQLACGTALEHGVMLTRVWVSESPEEVFKLVWRIQPSSKETP